MGSEIEEAWKIGPLVLRTGGSAQPSFGWTHSYSKSCLLRLGTFFNDLSAASNSLGITLSNSSVSGARRRSRTIVSKPVAAFMGQVSFCFSGRTKNERL